LTGYEFHSKVAVKTKRVVHKGEGVMVPVPGSMPLAKICLVTLRTSMIFRLLSPVRSTIFSMLTPLINSLMIPRHWRKVILVLRFADVSFLRVVFQ